jgi:uncharacterized protein YndB with AHSA1/START domain
MTDDIVHEATYPYPPEAVWRALTTPEALGAWLMETDFQKPEVGHKFQFRDKPRMGWSGVTNCEVAEVVPSRRFVIKFGDAADGFPSTRVIWDLEPVPEGTRVKFRHTGFTGFKGWMMRQGMNQGWGGMVRHAIPYVVGEMEDGRMPPRAQVKEMAKKGRRADHASAKARA